MLEWKKKPHAMAMMWPLSITRGSVRSQTISLGTDPMQQNTFNRMLPNTFNRMLPQA